MREMTPEEFRAEFGYLPGSSYDGGVIEKTASDVNGERIVYRDNDSTTTYHMRWYRQHLAQNQKGDQRNA